jgi:hypothetical protein
MTTISLDLLLAITNSFYTEGTDAVGNKSAPLQAKIMIALKALENGCNPFAFRDYFQMSKTINNFI